MSATANTKRPIGWSIEDVYIEQYEAVDFQTCVYVADATIGGALTALSHEQRGLFLFGLRLMASIEPAWLGGYNAHYATYPNGVGPASDIAPRLIAQGWCNCTDAFLPGPG